ncbi:NAD+ synthase [Halobaculum gomorrense]|uniref:NAD+ synthase n=1 Tax=Halobaculum gomorrense TaxID=43928 RepID=UPI00135658F7|nr:NAD+ synthase [Halobaculum gomorrense]
MATGHTDNPPAADGSLGRDSPEAGRSRSTECILDAVEAVDADGVVVCLSGGIDSATAAALAVDALGASAVTALIMPTDTTAEAAVADARAFADSLGVDRETVALAPAVDVFKRYVAPRIAPAGDVYAAGNLAARLRMACAYLVADATNALVVGTSNRSERLLGYFTKYGDGAADVFPLAEHDKTAVRALATRLDVPPEIVSKPPSADFWPEQTDESELGAPYAALDRVLAALLAAADDATPPEPVDEAASVDRETVERVVERVAGSAHKREYPPAPPRPAETELGVADALGGGLVDGGDRAAAAVADARDLVCARAESADADGVVVDLGAGVDAAVTAAIAADALGPERVRGVHLPCHKAAGFATPTPESIADRVGIDCDRVTIRPLVAELEAALPARIAEEADASGLAEFVSRVRMACRYYVANAESLLVAGTTTRTDALLGRATPYGDGAADLRPLGGSYASELGRLCQQVGLTDMGSDDPALAVDSLPLGSADLTPGAVAPADREDWGSPDDHARTDSILAHLVDRDLGIERTAATLGVDRETVRRCAERHVRAERTGTAPPTAPGERDRRRYFHEIELQFESDTRPAAGGSLDSTAER